MTISRSRADLILRWFHKSQGRVIVCLPGVTRMFLLRFFFPSLAWRAMLSVGGLVKTHSAKILLPAEHRQFSWYGTAPLSWGNLQTIYLVTSSQEEIDGCLRRALTFHVADENPDQVLISSQGSSRLAISVRPDEESGQGMPGAHPCCGRYLPLRHHIYHGGREHQTDSGFAEFVAKIYGVNLYSLTSSMWDDSPSSACPVP
ncbi:hypothetical protein EI94DRAFT_272149 [Lactarius quietus]|nr:hypothetical protein EI94DRAFT_272149 [Lactarius quietus]